MPSWKTENRSKEYRLPRRRTLARSRPLSTDRRAMSHLASKITASGKRSTAR